MEAFASAFDFPRPENEEPQRARDNLSSSRACKGTVQTKNYNPVIFDQPIYGGQPVERNGVVKSFMKSSYIPGYEDYRYPPGVFEDLARVGASRYNCHTGYLGR